MDIQQQKRPHLEPIQEESEPEDEDESEKSRTSEEEDECFQIRAGVETEVTGAEEYSEEEGDELRVMRLRRRLSSQSHESFPHMRFGSSEQAESENLSPPAQNSHAAALSDEGQRERPREEKRSTRRQLTIKVSKVKWQILKPSKAAAPRKTSHKAPRAELFPEWLVDLMVNVEEATTHQLVVE